MAIKINIAMISKKKDVDIQWIIVRNKFLMSKIFMQSQNQLCLFMQKYFHSKSHKKNHCECVIYFQKFFRHCFIWELRKKCSKLFSEHTKLFHKLIMTNQR